MKRYKSVFVIWTANLGAALCLAYSTMCHWFGFSSESKNNRLELLLIFGAIFFFLSWWVLKSWSAALFANISRQRLYLFLGAAAVIAGAFGLLVLPPSQNALFSGHAQPGETLTTTMRLLSIGLKLSDFASLAGLFFFGEMILSKAVSCWGLITGVFPRLLAVFFPLGAVLLIGLLANLIIPAPDQAGMSSRLKPLSSNDLLAVDAALRNIRVDTIFFENYAGWTLVAPADLLDKLKINISGELISYGRIGSIVTMDYPADLSDQEMKELRALKNVDVDNGSDLHYIAILENDANKKICLRTHKNEVFIVPISFSPICENR
jgi:hypothetical protein